MRRRKPLSLTAIHTHRALMLLLGIITSLLFIGYVFLMNHLSMQGYILSRESEKHIQISSKLEQIEAKMAHSQASEYIAKSSVSKPMVVQARKSYVVVPNTVTARR